MTARARQEKITLQISIALAAGMFSILPVSYGAPVKDHVAVGGAQISVAGTTTNITSTTKNNVIEWRDFSVAQGETVQFDNGVVGSNANNYLNIVTGGTTSYIDGAIKGGNEVYLINPNGVIMGQNATVNVGAFYASTKASVDYSQVTAESGSLADKVITSGTATNDIINMGTIQADKVQVEGNNVTFLNTANVVQASGAALTDGSQVTIKAAGDVWLGHEVATTLAADSLAADDASYQYQVKNLEETANVNPYYAKVIRTQSQLNEIDDTAELRNGIYMLGQDIPLTGTHTPIGQSNAPFSGHFNGNFFKISNLTIPHTAPVESAGLFGYTDGAAIENVGVEISAMYGRPYAGGLVGIAKDTTLRNVYATGGMIASFDPVGTGIADEGIRFCNGGIIGRAVGTITVDGAYNMATIYNGSGIIGSIADGANVAITNSYNAGTINNDSENNLTYYGLYNGDMTKLVATIGGGSATTESISDSKTGYTVSVSNCYDNGRYIKSDANIAAPGTVGPNGAGTNSYVITGWSDADKKDKSKYAFLNGSDATDIWRIYDGHSTPLLRSFLKANGHGTIAVDFNYGLYNESVGGTSVATKSGDSLNGVVYNGYYIGIDSIKDSSRYDKTKIGKTDERQRNAGTLDRLFYSTGQDGYDLASTSLIIKKRNLAPNSGTFSADKVYDGNVSANAALQAALLGTSIDVSTSDSDTGLVSTDVGKVALNTNAFSAAYRNADNSADNADVGNDKPINISITDAANLLQAGADGNESANYTLDTSGLTNGVRGNITPRKVYVKLEQATGIDKTYDGSTDIVNPDNSAAYSPENNVVIDTSAGRENNQFLGTGTYLQRGAASYDKKNAGARTVSYAVGLTDAAKSSYDSSKYNYQLIGIAANGQEYDLASAGNKLQATGTIKKRDIPLDNIVFHHADGTSTANGGIASKAYDGNAAYGVSGMDFTAGQVPDGQEQTIHTGIIADDAAAFTGFSVAPTATFRNATDTDDASSVADAKKIRYTITLAGNNDAATLANYTLGESEITNGQVTVTRTGEITKRVINVVVGTPNGITKTYDGTAAVVDANNAGYLTFGGDYVRYADGTTADHQLVDDGTKFAISAVYDDVNVKRDSTTGAVLENGHNVTYTVAIVPDTGAAADNSANYALNPVTNAAATVAQTSNETTINNVTGTINPAGVQVVFASADKYYDGTSYLLDAQGNSLTNTDNGTLVNPSYMGIHRKAGANQDDDVKISFASREDARYASANVARENNTVVAQDITYKVSLSGNDSKNYYIADSSWQPISIGEDGKVELTGSGKIVPKILGDDDIAIGFGEISKIYDMTPDVDQAAGYINTFTIGGVVLKDATQNNLDAYCSAIGAEFQKNNGERTSSIDATKAEYTITLNDAALSNFDLGQVTFYDSSTNALTATAGDAHITPKEVTVVFNAPTQTLTKDYDGTETVRAADGSVYNVGTDMLDVTGIYADDANAAYMDRSAINAHYDGKDVAYDSSNQVTEKNVYYDVVLDGTSAKNYKLVYGTSSSTVGAAQPKLTVTGKGIIRPKEITADFNFAEAAEDDNFNKVAGDTTANKVYDGHTNVKTISSKVIEGVNGETIQLHDDDISGTYGSMATGTFVENGDVNWSSNTALTEAARTGYKAVKYTGLQNALVHATGTNGSSTGTFSAKNYTIADTVYFDEAKQKGKIRRLALTEGDIEADWTDESITKVYDGTPTVINPERYFSIYTEVTGEKVDLGYNLEKAVYNDNQVDVVAAKGVTYTIKGLQDQAFKNFSMYGITSDDYHMTVNSADKNKFGSITPRVLKLDFTQDTGLDKVYDGTTAVADAANVYEFVVDEDGTKHDLVSGDGVTLMVTSEYGDKNANADTTEAAQAGNGKVIKHTVAVNGDDKGNYTIEALDADGRVIHEDTTTYEGAGDIIKRKVYVDFQEGKGIGLNKQYDSTDNVDEAYKQLDRFKLAANGQDTGALTDDASIIRLGNSISAAYRSGNVKRDNQGKVTTQDVVYSSFQLEGSDKDNYYLATQELTGKGTIKPITVGVSVNNGPVKEYDGTTAVEDAYKTASNITVDTSALIGSDTINVGVVDASYADKNAGSGTKGYTYQLSWDNGNYELGAKPTDAGETLTTAGLSAELNGTNGTITPRILTVKSLADAEKEYDGTTAVKNAAVNVAFHEQIVRGDDIGLTASATYDDANAGVSEDTDGLIQHTVNYKLQLANGNYQLAATEVQGKGTIRRKGLEVVAEPATVDAGDPMPAFYGTVNGLLANDTGLSDKFQFKTDGLVTTDTPGEYAVYGWYKGLLSGKLGQNYTFAQAAANEKAFTVQMTDPGREYRDTVNPHGQFTSDHKAYQQAALDPAAAGEFNSTGKAALEYRDSNGTVLGFTTISSGDVYETGPSAAGLPKAIAGAGGTEDSGNAGGASNPGAAAENGSESVAGDDGTNSGLEAVASVENGGKNKLSRIGITGDDVVNMENVDAGNVAQIEVDGDGSIVNLEIVPLATASADKDAQAEIKSAG
ncbi:filamentous hemagglutinin family N-terminal domain-containing protein [Selenomonas sp. GACV-9]|uniref:two-partner secretion domain-containing protein n=1 Tax=Selenomonas sp. GACV-9 TaxID=3158782 RepID=UPI0008F0F0E2|nr:filamentous hemagglutinin family N-terminal domain-containing protein [Selenomonas ruminantium]